LDSGTFAYDSLSRLSWATNPESGTNSYFYDANGNLTFKTDARNITTTLGYDQFNRLRTKNYTDGTPAVTYNYGTDLLPENSTSDNLRSSRVVIRKKTS
jgi:YD repeat-containing protein